MVLHLPHSLINRTLKRPGSGGIGGAALRCATHGTQLIKELAAEALEKGANTGKQPVAWESLCAVALLWRRVSHRRRDGFPEQPGRGAGQRYGRTGRRSPV
jgi:hypothetical protein